MKTRNFNDTTRTFNLAAHLETTEIAAERNELDTVWLRVGDSPLAVSDALPDIVAEGWCANADADCDVDGSRDAIGEAACVCVKEHEEVPVATIDGVGVDVGVALRVNICDIVLGWLADWDTASD